MADMPSIAVVVPTLNAGPAWRDWWQALQQQTLQPARILVVDSASVDDTVEVARKHGAQVEIVAREDFNHGGTRRWAAQIAYEEVLVYMTQDALLATPHALENLAGIFTDASVGAAYGRQLPRHQADAVERHNRLFSYPARSHRVEPAEAHRWGIRGPFLSDSFTAYRRAALEQVGGFPQRVIVSEDMYVGARLLQNGWTLAYAADASVHHSHAYRLKQEVHRYFDIGAFYSEQPWLLDAFGHGSGEGFRYVRSELTYLLRHAPWRVPDALMRTGLKFVGFHLGRRQRMLPASLRLRLSGQKYYWR